MKTPLKCRIGLHDWHMADPTGRLRCANCPADTWSNTTKEREDNRIRRVELAALLAAIMLALVLGGVL